MEKNYVDIAHNKLSALYSKWKYSNGGKKKQPKKNIIFHYNLNIAATNPPEYIKEMSDSLEK